MNRGNQSSPSMSRHRMSSTTILSSLIALTLLLGACGGNGGTDNQGAEGDVAATALPAEEGSAATPTVEADSGSTTETPEATDTTGSNTSEEDAGDSETAVITSTELITSTEVTTDIEVTTDTTVIEQQYITTVVTNTDVVSNVVTTTDSSTVSETEVITTEDEVTETNGQGAANATTTPMAATGTATDTVQPTAQPGQGQTGAAGAQGATNVFPGVVDAQGKTILASALLGSEFLTSDGEVSGEVQDAVVDIQTGQLLYLLLEYGGVLDVGSTDLPAPLSAFSLKEDGALLLNISPENLQQFPDVGNEWPQAEQADWDSDVRDFWGNQGFDVATNSEVTGNRVRRLSSLLNGATSDVGMGAGTVSDMAVSLDEGRVVYVLVTFDDGTADGGWYAIPITEFDAENIDDGLAFRPDFDGTVLQNAPRFNVGDMGEDRFLPDNYNEGWQDFWDDLTNP